MDRNQIEEIANEHYRTRAPLAQVSQSDAENILINGYQYQLVANVRGAFDLEALKLAYNTFLSKYDYLLGDFGYEQLRLTGFYANDRNVNPTAKIGAVQDYLTEYATFGAPYFIIHNLAAKRSKPQRRRSGGRRNRSRRSSAPKPFIAEKVTTKKPPIKQRQTVVVAESKGQGKRHFKIRQKQR